MKILIQRVCQASVSVQNERVSKINKGLLLYLCLESKDTLEAIHKATKKIQSLRVFEDENGKMNLNINQVNGSILIVSQFTLSWSGEKGNRPSFENSMHPSKANDYYESFCKHLNLELKNNIQMGLFGADMKVSSINDGPVTFFLSF